MAELTDLGLVWTKINGEYVAKVESGGKTVVLKISNGVLTANGKTVPGVHPVVQDYSSERRWRAKRTITSCGGNDTEADTASLG